MAAPTPRSLVWATDIDVLAADHIVQRRDDYLVVRSPGSPTFWWGNLLLFEDPPGPGDGARWESLFELEFACLPLVAHRTFAWDRADGSIGAAPLEFAARGYKLDPMVGLVASPDRITAHPRANREVTVRPLDPSAGADEPLWAATIELQHADREPTVPAAEHREHCIARQHDLRSLFCAGRGAWYVALSPGGEMVAGCGIVATGTRGRFQAVVTAEAHRRRGICSRLVVEAARHAAAVHDLEMLVIVADAGYHALGLYESLGFSRRERVTGACRPPHHPRA